MLDYYDREGKLLNVKEWSHLLNDESYRVVRQDHLQNGDLLSTIWLGLNHNFSDVGNPLIFETMIFSETLSDHVGRWSTEAEALKAHQDYLATYRFKKYRRAGNG